MNYIDKDIDKHIVTSLISLLAEALPKDYKLQAAQGLRTKNFSLAAFNRQIGKKYKLGNAQALTYGKVIGKKIRNGQPLRKTDSPVKAPDLESICLYILKDQGSLGWPNFVETIRVAALKNQQFAGLMKIHSESPAKIVEDLKVDIGALAKGGGNLSLQLRDLADSIEPMEAKIMQAQAQARRLAEKSAGQANHIRALENAIIEFQEIIERLEAGARDEKDAGKKKEMLNAAKAFRARFSELVNL